MLLKWIGDSNLVTGVPGWQAQDHDESDPKVAKAKIASGLYEGPSKADRERAKAEAAEQKVAANAKAKRQSDQRIADAEAEAATAQANATATRAQEGREE